GAGLWDSWGQADTQQDKQCSIPNWVYYGFRGTLSLDSQWASLPPGSQQESPSTLTTRSICTPPPNPAPSCAHPTWGDWVEPAGGQVADMSPVLRRALADRGSSSMPYSDRLVPGTTTRFGKGLVILVRSEEHTSELQSRVDLVCRLLLEKKKERKKGATV